MSAKPLPKTDATDLKPSRPTSAECAAALEKCLEDKCAAALEKCLENDPEFAKKYKEECARRGWKYP
jgi:hypothetical protein